MGKEKISLIALGLMPVPGIFHLVEARQMIMGLLFAIILYTIFFAAIKPAIRTKSLCLMQGRCDRNKNRIAYWFNISVITAAYCIFSIAVLFYK